MSLTETDIAIIGAGPVGLFAVFVIVDGGAINCRLVFSIFIGMPCPQTFTHPLSDFQKRRSFTNIQ